MTGKKRGNMSAEKRKRVASMGGIAVSKNREFMAMIGKKGGLKTSNDRKHMAEIGKKGGLAHGRRKDGSESI